VINSALQRERLFVIISILLIGSALLLQQFGEINPNTIAWLFGLSFVIGGFYKAKEGVLATIKNKALNVEILMIMAALGAFILGEFQEGAILILIFSVSGVMESYTQAKSEKELTSLLQLAPNSAILWVNGEEQVVDVASVKVGDQVIVKVGQLIPVDGVVVSGSTSVDESTITGEFVPVNKQVKAKVFAGSINIESAIIVECNVDPKETVVQKIVDFVEQAQASETPSQTLVTRIEKVYVYVVILMAAMFMVLPPLFGWLTQEEAIYRGIIVLVVGSPCALVASIAPAMLASLSNAAKARILIKGGEPLELLLSIKAVMFDKTGTITDGTPQVKTMTSMSDHQKSVLLSMESQSNHPLAKAIVASLDDATQLACETSEVSGQGMTATIDEDTYHIGRFDFVIANDLQQQIQAEESKGLTVVTFFENETCIGYVSLQDRVRDDVPATIKALKEKGIQTVMLTGDNPTTAASIATQAGIDSFYAGLFPQQKVEKIQELQASLGPVMMIGDGINDAPALAMANVSIAMGSATDVSLETADIVLMNNKLSNLLPLFKLSQRTRRITLQNVIFSLSVIAILMVSNVFGVVELPTGVVAHEMSTILVILNSLRLLRA